MSKYIKLEDAIRKYAEMFADEAYWEHGVGNGKPNEEDLDIAREYYSDLPTIEVKGGDLEDAILLTKEAYSDLCLKASQVSDKAECDNCIWNDCNYNKIDWEVSEDCISRECVKCINCAENGSYKCSKCDGEMYYKYDKDEPQTYITEDRDTQILDAWQVHHRNTTTVEDEPTIEQSSIVRCKDCKHYHASKHYAYCTVINVKGKHPQPNDYCSYAEEK